MFIIYFELKTKNIMETVSNIMNIVFVLMFISIAFMFKNYYPKDINSLVGYRTKRSIASEKNWLFANKFSSNLLFKCTLVLPIVQVLLYLIFGSLVALIGMLSLWVLMLFAVILITEKKMMKMS